MRSRSFWIPVSAMVFAAALLGATGTTAGTHVGYFLLAEAALFALAFLLAAVLGEPGRVLGIGAALGVGLAFASAALLGEDCEDSFLFCITPESAFVLGLVAALVLYPGWALGAWFGALKRQRARRSEPPKYL